MNSVNIYTGKVIAERSEEHVVPRSLGGRLSSPDLVDKKTNDLFGHGIDAELEEALRSVRVMIDARNADGKSPRGLSKVQGDDGRVYRLDAGGVPVITPSGRIEELEPGKLFLKAKVPDEAALRKMLAPTARRAGKDVNELVQKAMSISRTTKIPAPGVTLSLSLWQHGPYRATAKIACNLLGLSAPATFLRSEFNEIRQYVFAGVKPSLHPVQAVKFDAGKGISDLDHLVKIEVTPSGDVLALVVYFGTFPFVVRLGHLPAPVQCRSVSYRVDQRSAIDRRDDERDLGVPIPSFEQAAAASHEEFAKIVNEQSEQVVSKVHRVHQRIWIDRITTPLFAKFFEDTKSREQTEADRAALYGAIIMKLVEELAPRIARESQMRRLQMDQPSASRDESDDKVK